MYSLLIVDDERNIREGIVKNCQWAAHRIGTVRQASNGKEALELIQESVPDIMIADVRMPIMNGLELLKRVYAEHPRMLTVILSGYDEFEYVRTALKFRVQEYLLKPCSVREIHDVLDRLVLIMDEREQQQEHLERLKKSTSERDVLNLITANKWPESKIYDCLTDFEKQDLRLVLMQNQQENSWLPNEMKKTVADCFQNQHELYCCELTNNELLICMDYYPYVQLQKELQYLQSVCAEQFGILPMIAVGEKTAASRIHASYINLRECLKISFFKETGSIISTFDKPEQKIVFYNSSEYLQKLKLAISGLNRTEALVAIEEIMHGLNNPAFSTAQVKAFAIEVFLSVEKLMKDNDSTRVFEEIGRIANCGHLESLMQILQSASVRAIDSLENTAQQRRNALVQRVEEIVEDRISDETLSLNQIANEVIFVNPAYLGKLFQKEKNVKFSEYVTAKRMERAKQMLLDSNEVLVKTVTKECGFGYNTQYFSKVFKCYTGYTPKEFKAKMSAFSRDSKL